MYAGISAVFAGAVFVNFASPVKNKYQQENHVPVVKITRPSDESSFPLNVPTGYNITVSDKEDGDSRYGEINSKEVLLQVKYFADSSKEPSSRGSLNDAQGLAIIRASNCFNCHAFSSKGIGPSFSDLVKKYAPTAVNITLVAKHVKDGSTGIWGNVTMPTHPELTYSDAQVIVDWILKKSCAEGTDYYIGAAGTFRLKPPAGAPANGVYMLTASYIDHGIKTDSTKPHLEGSDVIFVKAK